MQLEVSFTDTIFLFFTIVIYALYNIYLKRFKGSRIILLFWINNFAYLGFTSVYFVKKYIFQREHHAFQKLLFTFTLTNIPLYFIMAVAFVASLYVYDQLLEKYDISQVYAITQMSLLFSAAGYLLLGDPLNLAVLLGVIIVFLGAIISVFKTFHLSSPFAQLKHIPRQLLQKSIIESLLLTTVLLITFIVTQKTEATELIMHFLKHIYSMPFSFLNPFYFNVGVRFFIVFVFIMYIWHSKKTIRDAFKLLKTDTRTVLVASLLYFVYAFAYQEAYLNTPNKNVFSALTKLTIPTVLVLSSLLLHEKITKPKIIGATLIVAGGLVTVFF